MKDYIEERAIEIAGYMIESKATVRQTAKKFGISKSTVHKDMVDRLVQINPELAGEVRKVLNINKQERHIRGGLATREKYQHRLKNPNPEKRQPKSRERFRASVRSPSDSEPA